MKRVKALASQMRLFAVATAALAWAAFLPVRRWLADKGDSVIRFDVHQRAQHFLMMSSFLVLAFTGLPQKFHYFWLSQDYISALGGLENVQQIHRTAAWVMVASVVYHGAYLAYRLGVRRRFGDALSMAPSPKDIRDLVQSMLYWFGFAKEGPKFGRYSYLEKFDYWAVFWGIIVIGGSGFILMFPVVATKLLPGGIVPVAHAAHSDEAVLAAGWIFLMHIVRAHLWPGIFPFNTAIFLGRVPRRRYAEEHPLEYQRWVEEGKVPPVAGEGETKRRAPVRETAAAEP